MGLAQSRYVDMSVTSWNDGIAPQGGRAGIVRRHPADATAARPAEDQGYPWRSGGLPPRLGNAPVSPDVVPVSGTPMAGRNGGRVGISYVEFEDDAGILRRYRKHVNGRGLVATTAKVDATAFVDPTAYVDPGAEVQRGATLSHGAWVEQDAIVAENATIGVNARIGRGAVIGRFAVVGPYAAVGAGARVQNGARVPREATVAEGSEHRASGDDLRRLGLAA
ncbi:hypothetical protein ESO86_09815 [Agromyces binzhouensis]|uniref:Transferase n=1 Tax=Agromyces binzhouensis TaxID=1817495 RepID=A0A4Q2JH31_9MICO|nr:hypothetical protein ESO86_09815 [Agromyces binzhouensis]